MPLPVPSGAVTGTWYQVLEMFENGTGTRYKVYLDYYEYACIIN